MTTTQHQARTEHTAEAPRPPRQANTGTLLLGVLLVAAGCLWLLASLGVDLPVTVVAPALLVALGVAVAVGGARGEDTTAIGLAVFVGVWLSLASLLAVVVDTPLTGAIGDVDVVPSSAEELDTDHRLFAGTQTLDLREVSLDDGPLAVEVSTVLGEVEVIVPEGLAVRADVAVAAGTLALFGETVDGVGLDEVVEHGHASDAQQRIDLHVRVGLGQVTLRGG